MKTILSLVLALSIFAGTAQLHAAEGMPEMPKPQKEHEWFKQLEGEWAYEVEMPGPDGKPQKITGSETVRLIGGFWSVAENKGEMMGSEFKGVMTLGFDPAKGKYVGTWIDSMTSYLWVYEGTVDASGKLLTLESEGPCPGFPGKVFKFKEQLEIKDANTKVFTSNMQGEDGNWTKMMTINYTRKP